jgi:hypothetical protein
LAPVGWRWVKNRPARLLGRLVDDGLLSSVVNGCQRSGGFGREDWDHKGKRQKAGKAESRESIRPGNTESQRTQREKSRWWGHVWEMANPAKTCNGRFWMLPYEAGCKRRKGRKSFGNVGFSTFNPTACPFVRRPSANRSQTVHCHRTLCPKSPANHLLIL